MIVKKKKKKLQRQRKRVGKKGIIQQDPKHAIIAKIVAKEGKKQVVESETNYYYNEE